jgi:hypothetical protein
VLKKRGNIDGEITQRVVAAGKESNIENTLTMNNKRNIAKKWCLRMQQVEKKERRKVC